MLGAGFDPDTVGGVVQTHSIYGYELVGAAGSPNIGAPPSNTPVADRSRADQFWNAFPEYVGFYSTVTLLDGSTFSFSDSTRYYRTYTAPADNQTQQYYDIWTGGYYSLMSSWYSALIIVSESGLYPFVSPETVSLTAGAAPKLASYASYAAYATAYLSWLRNSGTFGPDIMLTPPPPEPSGSSSLSK